MINSLNNKKKGGRCDDCPPFFFMFMANVAANPNFYFSLLPSPNA